MKKLLLIFTLLYAFCLDAQTENLDGLCSIIVKDAKYNYCLQIGSGTAIHLFDLLPKIKDYGYTGDAAYNDPSNGKSIFYPTYQNTGQKYELKQYIKTYKGNAEMVVTFTDLDLADILGKEEFSQSMQNMKKQFTDLGMAVPEEIDKIAFTGHRVQQIEAFKIMYAAAKQLNADYIPSEGAGMMPITLDNYENAFVSYKDFEKTASFSATYADKYLFTIEIKGVDKYNSCSTVMTYLLPYLSQIKLGLLDPNIWY